MVNSLRIAGYNITGIEILEQELKNIISHELEFYMSVQVDRSREKAQIKALLRNMKAMVERITDHKETDVVSNPEYCSFFLIKFYGKELPLEMTFNKHGFIMRRKFKLDFPN